MASVLMYHKHATKPVQVHPGQVENMKQHGWTDKKPPARSDQPKTEVKNNG